MCKIVHTGGGLGGLHRLTVGLPPGRAWQLWPSNGSATVWRTFGRRVCLRRPHLRIPRRGCAHRIGRPVSQIGGTVGCAPPICDWKRIILLSTTYKYLPGGAPPCWDSQKRPFFRLSCWKQRPDALSPAMVTGWRQWISPENHSSVRLTMMVAVPLDRLISVVVIMRIPSR